MRTFLQWTFLIFLVPTVLLGLVLFLMPRPDNIFFNQMEIEQVLSEHNSLSLNERVLSIASDLSWKLRRLTSEQSLEPSFVNPESVIAAVLQRAPLLAVVHPSEGYYYFRLQLAEGEVGGNVRVNDLERGALGYGYYYLSPSNDQASQPMTGYLTAENGLQVRRISSRLWKLTFSGINTHIVRSPVEPSNRLPPPLREGEEIVSWIRDESAVPFFLVFDRITPSFFYVLDETYPSPEAVLSETELLIGQRTGFVWLQEKEPQRKVLIGVGRAQISSNSYFDGPFDQIPAYQELQEQAYLAYPYLKLGGTDKYGYFCLNRLVRVGITSYEKYESLEALRENFQRCRASAKDPRQLRHCATFDSKQSFHRESDAFTREGDLHKGTVSHCEHRYLATTAD